MATYKTPGVYVEEISTFPPSVAEVGTAIPAFIGYTEMATKVDDGDLTLVPTKIYSLAEYELYYGGPKADPIVATVEDDGSGGYTLTSLLVDTVERKSETGDPTLDHLLYHAVRMYFDNGGAQCYIVSVGAYNGAPALAALDAGLDTVALEDEPTLIVIPEAVKLNLTDYGTLAQAVLLQCSTLGDRFALYDVWGAYAGTTATADDTRGKLTGELKYGAAYYPYLKTAFNHELDEDTAGVATATYGGTTKDLSAWKTDNTAVYNFVKSALKDYYVTMPPGGAVAGVYAATDAARGVWKAPANVALNDVIEPVIKVDTVHQDDLNVDATTGKSINVIRAFTGKGSLVWGARTLAGNDNEWRYVPVRRFFNMVEESVMKSTQWAVFEPNTATTWVKVRGMIENYLIDKWREGALAGAAPKDAFYVRCGIGTTMTSQDILEGRMNVEIGMAVVRPAEFIVLKFSHKLQTS